MNGNLAAAGIMNYRVKIQFYEGLLSSDIEELIKTTMNWRTSQVPRAGLSPRRYRPRKSSRQWLRKTPLHSKS